MAEIKKLNPLLKLVLEIGPVAVYFVAYRRFAEQSVTFAGTEYSGIVAATAIFVPLILLSLVVSWVLTRELPRMAVFTAIIVVVFGGATIWFNDDTFTKMRPTVIYGLFAFVLGFGVWVQKRSWLRYLMGEMMPLTEQGWMLFTRNWAIFFLGMALFNEFTWRLLGEEAWVFLDTFGQMILTFIFLATQYPLLQRHSTEEAE